MNPLTSVSCVSKLNPKQGNMLKIFKLQMLLEGVSQNVVDFFEEAFPVIVNFPDGVSITQIIPHVNCSKSTAYAHFKKLIDLGYINRFSRCRNKLVDLSVRIVDETLKILLNVIGIV